MHLRRAIPPAQGIFCRRSLLSITAVALALAITSPCEAATPAATPAQSAAVEFLSSQQPSATPSVYGAMVYQPLFAKGYYDGQPGLNARAPLISLDPPALPGQTILQGQTAPSQQFKVRNGADTTPMAFTVLPLDTWATVNPGSGTAPPAPETDFVAINVNYLSAGLIPNVYNGEIVVTAPSATNNPQSLPITLTVRPGNDDFARHFTLLGDAGTTSGRTVTATTESGEPSHSPLGDGPFHSVWWQWTAPNTGFARFTAVGSSGFVPVLASYTGNAVGALTPIAKAGTPGSNTAVLTFPVTAGQPYQIALDGMNGTNGDFSLTWVRTKPQMVATPTTLTASMIQGKAVPSPVGFTLSNASFGQYGFTITPDQPQYFDIIPDSGTVTETTPVPVSVSFTPQALSILNGVHTFTFTVTSPEAGNSPQTVALVLTVRPPNDQLEDRIALTSSSGTALGYNITATIEPGEPPHAPDGNGPNHSIWWAWQPPEDGTGVFSTQGSDFQTVLAAYSTSSTTPTFSDLTFLANAAAGTTQTGCQVSIDVTSDTMYIIAVDGYATAAGNVQLNWSIGKPIIDVSPVQLARSTVQGRVPAAQQLAVTNLGMGILFFNVSVSDPTILSVTPTSGSALTSETVPITVTYLPGVANLINGIYSYTITVSSPLAENSPQVIPVTLTVRPPNDDFADRTPITGKNDFATGWNGTATKEPGEPSHAPPPFSGPFKSIWWTWTAPGDGRVKFSTMGSSFDTAIAIYTGTALNNLTQLASDGGPGATAITEVTEGTAYQIAVDTVDKNFTGDVVLSWLLTGPTIVVNPSELHQWVTQGMNASAQGFQIGNSGPGRVHYTNSGADPWVVPTPTTGITRNTWHQIWAQYPTASLLPGVHNSTITVSDPNAENNPQTLAVTMTVVPPGNPPDNDMFANRRRIEGLDGTTEALTMEATAEPYEPTHWQTGPYHSVWYTWTPPSNSRMTIDTQQSSFQSVLAVYTGNTLKTLRPVTVDDPTSTRTITRYTFTAQAGTTYQIAVDGYSAAQYGRAILRWSQVKVIPMVDDVYTSGVVQPPGSPTGWSWFGFQNEMAWTDYSDSSQAYRGNVIPLPDRYRVAGLLANQSEWLPYSVVGSDMYVRAKYFIHAGGQTNPTNLNQIPNLRLRLANRFAVNSMLEVFHHMPEEASPEQIAMNHELRPSTIPTAPSVYRVDMDPVDVPYLASNASFEGMMRGMEAYAIFPEDQGYIAMTESWLGVYPSRFVPSTQSPAKTYATSASGAGDLAVIYPNTDLQLYNIILSGQPGDFGTKDFTPGTIPTYRETSAGITMDSRAVPTNRIGVATREINPDQGAGDYPTRVRVEDGKQYIVRWHLTSTQESNRQSQIRLRSRAVKFAWSQKYEVGGAWGTGASATIPNANNSIAQQSLPGIGCENPDKNTPSEQGGWYTMLVNSPLNTDIRPEFPTGTPISTRMPVLWAQPGQGNDAFSRRDLLVGLDLIDTLSAGAGAYLERGNVTLDRIEVRIYSAVPD